MKNIYTQLRLGPKSKRVVPIGLQSILDHSAIASRYPMTLMHNCKCFHQKVFGDISSAERPSCTFDSTMLCREATDLGHSVLYGGSREQQSVATLELQQNLPANTAERKQAQKLQPCIKSAMVK